MIESVQRCKDQKKKHRKSLQYESLHGLLSFSTIDRKGVQAERVLHSIFYCSLKCIICSLGAVKTLLSHAQTLTFFVNRFAVELMLSMC